MTVNDRFRELFAKTKKKQIGLARYLGVSRSLVSLWYSGSVEINPHWYPFICNYFDIPIMDLIGGVTNEKVAIYHVVNCMTKDEKLNLIWYIMHTLYSGENITQVTKKPVE